MSISIFRVPFLLFEKYQLSSHIVRECISSEATRLFVAMFAFRTTTSIPVIFPREKRTESVFPFRDSAVIILDLNSGITYVHLVVPWDLIHLRTSLIVPDNFGIFVAYGFWKFDATRPAIASTRDFLPPIAPFFRDLLKLMETRNCYESTVYCSPERVLMKTFRYSILKME